MSLTPPSAGATTPAQALVQLFNLRSIVVVFLDIQMPGATGLEVARQVGTRARAVFITAYDQHAVQAFEHGAVDYLLEPLVPARLFTAIARLKERLTGAPPDLGSVLGALGGAPTAPRPYVRWINASVGQSLRLITVDEVLYFQSDNKYTRVVVAGVARDFRGRLQVRLKQGSDTLVVADSYAHLFKTM